MGSASLFSQNDLDVMRYSQTGFGGDARFMSMGGSMGALGANLSTLNYNPAGMAVFRKGEFAITGGLRFANATAEHYGTTSRDFKANATLGLIGFSSAWEEESPYRDETSKKKFKDWSRRHSIGFTYNRIANFNSNVTIQGNLHGKTIVDDFLASAQGYQPQDLSYYYEGMAFNTYLIDTFPGTINEYGSYFYTDKTFGQTKVINVTGSLGEYSLAYGYAMDNKTYFGVALGIPSGKWNYSSDYAETDVGDSTEYFQSLSMSEVIQTRSVGVNLKLGLIHRLSENIRLGLYYHTPTAFSLTDAYQSSIDVKYDSIFGTQSYTSDPGSFKYGMRTPMRFGGSLAYIYEKLLAFNIDAEYVGYNEGSLRSRDYSFADVNNAIRKKYASTVNFRAGIELNTKPVVFRAGYASYGSPFGDMFSGKGVKNSYTGGIGFRENPNRYFDIAVVFDRYNEDYYIYNPNFIDASKLSFKATTIMLTYGIKF